MKTSCLFAFVLIPLVLPPALEPRQLNWISLAKTTPREYLITTATCKNNANPDKRVSDILITTATRDQAEMTHPKKYPREIIKGSTQLGQDFSKVSAP